MPGRRKQKVPKVRPHYEDDELRLHIAIYLAGLPDDHPAVEAWSRDRSIHEIVRAFPEGEERTACWTVLRPHWEAWEARFRASLAPQHGRWIDP